jgi:hypothetical protein
MNGMTGTARRPAPATGRASERTPGAAESSPAPDGPPGARGSWVVSLLVLIVGMFMSVLDVTIVNVAIPAIQDDLGTTTEDVLWMKPAGEKHDLVSEGGFAH